MANANIIPLTQLSTDSTQNTDTNGLTSKATQTAISNATYIKNNTVGDTPAATTPMAAWIKDDSGNNYAGVRFKFYSTVNFIDLIVMGSLASNTTGATAMTYPISQQNSAAEVDLQGSVYDPPLLIDGIVQTSSPSATFHVYGHIGGWTGGRLYFNKQ
jgi:hypothetical protein